MTQQKGALTRLLSVEGDGMPLPTAAETGLPAFPAAPWLLVLVLLIVLVSLSPMDSRRGLMGCPGSCTALPVWNMARRSSQVDMLVVCEGDWRCSELDDNTNSAIESWRIEDYSMKADVSGKRKDEYLCTMGSRWYKNASKLEAGQQLVSSRCSGHQMEG